MGKNNNVDKSHMTTKRIEDKSLNLKIETHLDRVSIQLNNYTQLLSDLEKKLFLNSILSYILFFAIIISVLYVIFNERSKSLTKENVNLNNLIETNEKIVTDLKSEINGFKNTKRKTKILLEEFLNTTSDPKKLVDDFEVLDKGFFSEVEKIFFQEKVDKLKIKLSLSFYENGKNYFQANSYSKAVLEFKESLKYNQKNPYINEINYYMGVSYIRMKRYPEAIPNLKEALVNNFDKKRADDILYYLGSAYDRTNNKTKAKEYYHKVIQQYSTGDKYWQAKKRWNALNKK